MRNKRKLNIALPFKTRVQRNTVLTKLYLKGCLKDLWYTGGQKRLELKKEKELGHILFDSLNPIRLGYFKGEAALSVNKTFTGYMKCIDDAETFRELEMALNRLDKYVLHMTLYANMAVTGLINPAKPLDETEEK